MNWINFPQFAIATIILWIVATMLLTFSIKKRKFAYILTVVGTFIIGSFIVGLWIKIDRPPMRTLGETRLWYSFFLGVIGFITYQKWQHAWFLVYSLAMGILFLIINIMMPETHDKVMMPALQSIWFVPHVIVYLFAYALLAMSALIAIKGMWLNWRGKAWRQLLPLADNFVTLGVAFLTLGLLFGALWAKQAWGNYWTWDPKETWAFITWIGYLGYMHMRHYKTGKSILIFKILFIAFIVLMLCWFGVNYMPSAQQSVHTYGTT